MRRIVSCRGEGVNRPHPSDVDDLEALRSLGADTVLLDAFSGDPDKTRSPSPHQPWQLLAAVAAVRGGRVVVVGARAQA